MQVGFNISHSIESCLVLFFLSGKVSPLEALKNKLMIGMQTEVLYEGLNLVKVELLKKLSSFSSTLLESPSSKTKHTVAL